MRQDISYCLQNEVVRNKYMSRLGSEPKTNEISYAYTDSWYLLW